MANGPDLGKHREEYRPSKRVWFWSCAGCVVATLVIGFGWGGWVTGGTATQMAADAAAGARAQLAATTCISRFEKSPGAAAELASLKKAAGYERINLIEDHGWVTVPGSKDPVPGAADLCAQKLVEADKHLPPG